MKPLYRYIVVGSLIVAPFAVVIAATLSARTAIPRLLEQEVEEAGARATPILEREFASTKTPTQLTEIEKRYWYLAQKTLQRDGASEIEADGVVAVLQGKFNRSGNYAIPIHVRAASVWGRRLWALSFVWESRRTIEKDHARPCRHWTLVIDADNKHHVLAEDTCR